MLRIFNRAFLIVIGFLIVFVAGSFVLSVITVPGKITHCESKTTIYLQHSLVHADFVIPSRALSDVTRSEVSLVKHPSWGEPNFMVFGLGDRDIYINTPEWADLKLRYAATALFLPTDRAIHVEPAYSVYEGWIPLELCDNQLKALEDYIRAGYTRDSQGKVIEMSGLTYTGYDKFFEADGTYTMFNSCNNWANSGLKAASIKAPIWSPFPQGVVYHAKRYKPPS